MEFSIDLWLEYLLRFSHLVAGIYWIGSSFYFIWLDSSFLPPEQARRNVEGEVYMVHGGFYYQVDKKKIYPGEIPKILHWFKWEATITWITGFTLLVYLYFFNGANLLIDPQVYEMTQTTAILISLAMMVGSWFVYDFICHPKIFKKSSISTILMAAFLFALTFMATNIFSGRGAFILMGAVIGTLMVLNVWVRILPGQAKMLKEAEAGEVPDYSASLKSKVRSVHNTYFIFPLLFIMLSNHYPAIYNHYLNWVLLILIMVSGALARHSMVTKVKVERWALVPAAIGLMAIIYLTALTPKAPVAAGDAAEVSQPEITRVVEFSEINSIVQARCLSCHSSANTDDVYKVAPRGILFETKNQLLAFKEKLRIHVVLAKSMPLMNKTNMTDDERNVFKKWLDQLDN